MSLNLTLQLCIHVAPLFNIYSCCNDCCWFLLIMIHMKLKTKLTLWFQESSRYASNLQTLELYHQYQDRHYLTTLSEYLMFASHS